MGYREIYKEENEKAQERYELVTDRLRSISEEETVPEQYRDYFSKAADTYWYDTANKKKYGKHGGM